MIHRRDHHPQERLGESKCITKCKREKKKCTKMNSLTKVIH
jgi:hypothetical protein